MARLPSGPPPLPRNYPLHRRIPLPPHLMSETTIDLRRVRGIRLQLQEAIEYLDAVASQPAPAVHEVASPVSGVASITPYDVEQAIRDRLPLSLLLPQPEDESLESLVCGSLTHFKRQLIERALDGKLGERLMAQAAVAVLQQIVDRMFCDHITPGS